MAPRRKREAVQVHFEFEMHAPGERHASRRNPHEGTKTVVMEHGYGVPFGTEITKGDVKREKNVRGRTRYRYLRRAWRTGKKVVIGESGPAEVVRKLRELQKQIENERLLMSDPHYRKPTLPEIIDYYKLELERDAIRNRLIRETIGREKKPIEAHYGTAHSLLSQGLREDGIEISREIKPQQFTMDSALTRKMLSGGTPSAEEYRKAFVSLLADGTALRERILQKRTKRTTDADMRLYDAVENALISRLSAKQIDKIIETRDPVLLLKYNNLPEFPSRRQVEEFLNMHSPFWRRQQGVAEREGARGNGGNSQNGLRDS